MSGATVLLVHHSALADAERGRGSSAFTAAQDFIGAVAQSDRGITLKATKNKRGPAGKILTWHLREGVLRPGSALGATTSEESSDADAVVAARAIRLIARPDLGVSRRQLAAEMTEQKPDRFGERVNVKTAGSRLSRAIKAAVEHGWIARRRNEFVPGPVEHTFDQTELSAALADLVGL
jgi:hypothetical protein